MAFMFPKTRRGSSSMFQKCQGVFVNPIPWSCQEDFRKRVDSLFNFKSFFFLEEYRKPISFEGQEATKHR